MSAKSIQADQSRFGLLQWSILLLGLATAAIHGILLNVMMGGLDVLFTLNAIGYLVLIAAYFLPQLSRYRNLVRWALIAFTAATIIAWIFMGERNVLGYTTKLIEVGLIVTLLLDSRQ